MCEYECESVCVCVCVCCLPVKSWSDSGMELEKLGEELEVMVLRVGLLVNSRR